MADRIVSGREHGDDAQFDARLRPASFTDFIGQTPVTGNLQVFITAARARGDVLDHVLLSGPSGLGKTTLARIIAAEMGAVFRGTSGPALERSSDLVGILTSLSRGDVLFVDEIHRLSHTVKEYLYSAMEDFFLDIVIDQGPNARTVKINIAPFTLVGATTREGLLPAPLRGRFGILEKLDFYPPADLARIVKRTAGILGIAVDPAGAEEIAVRGRGTPRVVNRYIARVRDFAQVQGHARITPAMAREGLEKIGVNAVGLDRMDLKILNVIRAHNNPVGIKTIAISVGEEEDTIEEVYEPFLIQQNYIRKTSRGRLLSPAGYRILGDEPPAAAGLFEE
ncbi:MAG: Holliday junction branch migration DNA helicase RuvB [Planctomycetota bacterium]